MAQLYASERIAVDGYKYSRLWLQVSLVINCVFFNYGLFVISLYIACILNFMSIFIRSVVVWCHMQDSS